MKRITYLQPHIAYYGWVVLIVMVLCVREAGAQNYTYFDSVYYGATWPYGQITTNLELYDGHYYLGSALSLANDDWYGLIPAIYEVNGLGQVLDVKYVYLDSTFNLINLAESFKVYSDGQFAWSTMTENLAYPYEFSGLVIFGGLNSSEQNTYQTELSSLNLVYDLEVTQELSNGNLLIGGVRHHFLNTDTNEYDYSELYLLILTNDGEVISESNNYLFLLDYIRVCKLIELYDGSILVCGITYPPSKPFLVRISADGQQVLSVYQWGLENDYDMVYAHAVPGPNGHVVVAYLNTVSQIPEVNYFSEVHLMEYDPYTEQVLWDKAVSSTMDRPILYDLVNTPDGGYAILGDAILFEPEEIAGWNSYIIRTDQYGEVDWQKYYFHYQLFWDEAGPVSQNNLHDLEVTPDGGFAAAGYVIADWSGHVVPTVQESWLIKLDMCGDVEWGGCPQWVGVQNEPGQQSLLTLSPNPASQQLLVSSSSSMREIQLYDLTGRSVWSRPVSGTQFQIDVSRHPAGMYLLRALTENGQEEARIIIE